MLFVLAVDLGASSGRVGLVDLDARPISVRVVHRFEHAAVRAGDGSLRWSWGRLVSETMRGLELGMEAAADTGGTVASIGVDAWGVDYGLLDWDGELLSAPYCYRDARTDGWREVVERIGAERLYRTTGVQLMQINTLFQLAAHDREELSRARRMLMLPELMVHALTGVALGERTSAGTTGLVDLATESWSGELLREIGVDASIMPAISRATAFAGMWRGVPVHKVGGHDTASAVVGAPLREGSVFISSGTWMLVGVEREAPDVSDAAMLANFSNEAGVWGNWRFLKNVMGLWMFEQCRASWGNPPVEELLDAAGALPTGGPLVDAMDARFLAPADMDAEVRAAAGLRVEVGRDVVVRCVLDSLAVAAVRIVREIEEITGVAAREIVVVGGGSQNWLLNRLIEDACGVRVRVGAAEATVLGNAIVQGMALGRFESVDEARGLL